MNTEHTKGPWRINGQTVTAQGDMKLTVCTCPSKVDPRPTVDAAASTHEQAKANARLIAAAPELLAALQKLEAVIHAATQSGCIPVPSPYSCQISVARDSAQAAIAKATGQ